MLGEMGHDATHFVLGHHWRNHFNKKAAESGSGMSVAQLRKWIDQPHPMGLPKEVQNLVILIFSEQTNRTLQRHGAPWDGTLTNLPDDCELKSWKGPKPAHWNLAVERAGSIFGEAPSPLLKASNVSNLATGVKTKVSEHRVACQGYCQRLKDRLSILRIDTASTDRMKTASATFSLVEKLHGLDVDDVVGAIAVAEIATTESAMGECLRNAAQLTGTIDTANWEIFEAIGKLTDDFKTRADSICAAVKEALISDEHVVALGPALKEAQSQALRLITDAAKPTDPRPGPGPGPKPPEVELPKSKKRVVGQDSRENLDLPATKDLLANLDQGLKEGQDIRLNVSWIIEEDGGDP